MTLKVLLDPLQCPRLPLQCPRLPLLLNSLTTQEANSTSQQPEMLRVPTESPQGQKWAVLAFLSPGSESGTLRDRERCPGLRATGSHLQVSS